VPSEYTRFLIIRATIQTDIFLLCSHSETQSLGVQYIWWAQCTRSRRFDRSQVPCWTAYWSRRIRRGSAR